MQTCRSETSDGDHPDKAPPIAMRGGLSGIFVDFDLLPRFLARAETTGDRVATVADWSALLDYVGFEEAYICNWSRIPEYRDFLFESPAADIRRALMRSRTADFTAIRLRRCRRRASRRRLSENRRYWRP